MHLSPVLGTFVSLLSVCCALKFGVRPQAGSPIAPGFYPKGNSLSSGAFKIQDVVGRFDVFGRIGKRGLASRGCGSNTLEACSEDPNECCEVGGTCCGNGRCCPPGNVCQINNLGKVVCCADGDSCFSVIRDRAPCTDKTAVPCANFTFCCPANNLCSVVNGQNLCTPNVSNSSSSSIRVSITSLSSSTPSVTSHSSSTPTVTPPTVTTPTVTTPTVTPPTVTPPTIVTSPSPVTVVVTVTPKTTLQPPTTPTTPISTPPATTPPPTTAAPTTDQSTTSIVTSVVSTVVEFQTIISSIEIASGVFSTTGLVVSSTRVFTTLAAADPTNPPSPSATSASTAPSAAVIAGASIAGTVVLAALGFLIFYCARRGRTRKRPDSLVFPPTMREPTIPVLLQNPDDRYRDVPVSPVAELSPTTSPTPRYSAMYGPPPPQGVVELQDQQAYPGAGGKYEQHPPLQGVAELQDQQVYPGAGGKYEQHPSTSYELPGQQQQPFIDPRGQGYDHNIGRGY